ncbi:hypothetical protein OIDMADRAFT_170366 [Oidiodendron maius Zn]|uniref:Carboxylic ester hydrolase n=1 Tax=Oidiodendron maius (strain Zn) TaxID=913774 RepID=A0A0C3GZR1_OIDMZ|nr:hypothetical protein OIDMADRAFT_170366 [Oidiodendron maius Zn]
MVRNRIIVSLAVILGCVTNAVSFPSVLPIVDLGYAVHQASLNKASGSQYYNFSNIRFGNPPVGNLRFTAPTLPTTIDRNLNLGQHGAICPQASPLWLELTSPQVIEAVLTGQSLANITNQPIPDPSTLNRSSFPEPDPRTSEDCLFLDVVVPTSIYSNRLANSFGGRGAPVFVNIFGGGYVIGDKNAQGNPAGLLARSNDGIIYVTFNYRLGLYGFLPGHEVAASGTANAALYDQELALQWVQKYIHLFGGDKDRVTIVGDSSGGGSVMHQITAYGGLKGKVPFQQAIAQSPGYQPIPGCVQQESIFQKTLQSASQITGRNISTLRELRSLSALDLYYTNCLAIAVPTYGLFTYSPVVDGKFAPRLPSELLLTGQFDHSLNLMLGHNADEGLLFTSPYVQNNSDLDNYVSSVFPSASQDTVKYITEVLYPPVFDGSLGYTSQIRRLDLLFSELAFTCNTRYMDLAFANKTYSYLFSVPPALHGDDNQYLYFMGNTSTLDFGVPINSTLAEIFQRYVTSFVTTGNPNRPGLPHWSQYGADSSVQNISFQGISPATDTVANERCTWWQQALYY